MKNIKEGFTHKDEYLVFDFCHEHGPSLFIRDYTYGFSKCSYRACNECYDSLIGPFRLVKMAMQRAYATILEVVKDKTVEGNAGDYYERLRIAYKNGYYIRVYRK